MATFPTQLSKYWNCRCKPPCLILGCLLHLIFHFNKQVKQSSEIQSGIVVHTYIIAAPRRQRQESLQASLM